jgi:hypothetical protein
VRWVDDRVAVAVAVAVEVEVAGRPPLGATLDPGELGRSIGEVAPRGCGRAVAGGQRFVDGVDRWLVIGTERGRAITQGWMGYPHPSTLTAELIGG